MMPSFDKVDPALLNLAVFDQRWSALARADIDLGTISTWDRHLPREQRILVPIDVQAYVVPIGGGEHTVPIRSFAPDPEPFATGSQRAAGVHLHWAMPDSLLIGKENTSTRKLELPRLPDRWVVIRCLLPIGERRAIVNGWVIDSPSGTITPLAGFDGTFPMAPADIEFLDPLDGGYGGSLLWTASYEASQRRFAIHDTLGDLPELADLAPDGFEGNHAVYTVCGWWSDGAQDPLSGQSGSAALDRRLAQLSWLVVHDGDDDLLSSEDPKLARLRDQIGFDTVDTDPPVELVTADRTQRLAHQGIVPNSARPVEKVAKVVIGRRLPTYSTMVHGAVIGVPIDGVLPTADDRPDASSLSVAVGLDVDDVVGAFGADALGLSGDQRLAAERLVAAFAGNLLDKLSTADGLSELEEREHAEGFWSFAGVPLPGSRSDRLRTADSAPVNPVTVGRKGRANAATSELVELAASLGWKSKSSGLSPGRGKPTSRSIGEQPPTRSGAATQPESREVVRAAPRLYRPQAPMVAVRGAKPSHRHHDDGLYDESGKLRCRYPRECVTAVEGVVDGATILPTLGNGAIPAEVLAVTREALLLDPYAYRWLAAAGVPKSLVTKAETRLLAEMVRLYGSRGVYDPSGRATIAPGSLGVARSSAGPTPSAAADRPSAAAAVNKAWSDVSRSAAMIGAQVAVELARFSQVNGTAPSPIAITTWRQPWIPMWLEWSVTLTGSDRLEGWELGSTDLEPLADGDGPPSPISVSYLGRSPLNEGVGDALRVGIEEWLDLERARDASNSSRSQISDDEAEALDDLADMIAPADLVSASLDGIREQLLGIPYLGHVARGPVEPDGSTRPLAASLPTPLFGGSLRLDRLRLVDTFGRTLEVPLDTIRTTTTLEIATEPTSVRLRPRVQHGARWLFRLVDPAYSTAADPRLAPEAFVDQIDTARAVNPIVGFLLPDHIDEGLEFFDVAGQPLGQLIHDEISGGVIWEPSPGRPLPPDAGPLADLADHTHLIGRLANGVVQCDVTARAGQSPGDRSSLSALLRAIDTTLWTVDTYGGLGSTTVAGLVGRPIAVVRATVRLETPDDLDVVSISHVGGADARRAAFAALDEQLFAFRLGDLHRSDDSLLGFFVDDDYTQFHVVDRVVIGAALESGRHRGFLGMLGDAPAAAPLDHPYVVAEDTLWIRPGHTTRLTLLMLPAGKVHLTSGILPRKALALGDDWVTPGMVKLMPSLRVGPLLVDPSEIRLPLVNLLGDRQTFTRRTGPLTWRDDPIVAATQTALLPRMPHEAQEGWVRVSPEEPTVQP